MKKESMLLPCPHCKRRFKLSPDRIPAGAAKLKCPACKGLFVVDTSPLRRVPDPILEPEPARPSPGSTPGEASPSAPAANPKPHEGPSRRHWFLSRTGILLSVSGLLVALIGILAPVVWNRQSTSVERTAPGGSPASYASPSPISNEPGKEASEEESVQQAKGNPLTYQSMWPFSPAGKQKSCDSLARLQDEWHRQKPADPRGFYAPWIAYLSLETSSSPACDLEEAFRIATDAIAKNELCGRGYAFLSAYYSYKRVLDRSRSFLEEALDTSPKDPWVGLVEGLFYERVLRDSERAIRILNGLLRKESSFALAQYHLAKIYIEQEEYGKARDLFLLLEKAFPRQQGFTSIRQSLAGIEHVPYYSAERAKALLNVSRALSGLMDYPIAGRLCRTVLEDMPGTLPKAEKKSAFYDLGRISEITGDKETAFTCYQNALRIDPFYRDARERLGSILKGDAQAS